MRAHHLSAIGFLAIAPIATGCHKDAASEARSAAPISNRACPAELSKNACARYQYYMGATDVLFAGLPESDARRAAIKTFTASQCDDAGKRLRAWIATAAAQRDQIEASELLPPKEQVLLRYGPSKDNFEIDSRDGALRDILAQCSGADVVAAISAAGLFPVTDGVLRLTEYKGPN